MIKKFLTTMLVIAVMATMVMRSPIQVRAAEEVGKLNVEYYMSAYPDVAAAFGNNPSALLKHYIEHGMAEGRIPYPGAQPGEYVEGYVQSTATPTTPAAPAATVTAPDAKYDLSDWTPDMLAALAQKQAEFDASGLVHVGWTEQQVQEKILSLKAVYPEGMTVGECDTGSSNITAALYGKESDWWLGTQTALGWYIWFDKNEDSVMPTGYVETKTYRRGISGNIRDIRVGDRLFTKGSEGAGHSSVVLSRDDTGITVVESNINDDQEMHWGRRITWNELENGTNNGWYKYTHYMY